jgi:hypothetical protein
MALRSNFTFAPAASRRKAAGHGIFGTIYVALGACGSSANPFFSSLYLVWSKRAAAPEGGDAKGRSKESAVKTYV